MRFKSIVGEGITHAGLARMSLRWRKYEPGLPFARGCLGAEGFLAARDIRCTPRGFGNPDLLVMSLIVITLSSNMFRRSAVA